MTTLSAISITPLPGPPAPGSIEALQRRLDMTRREGMNIMRDIRPGFSGRMPAGSLQWMDAHSRVQNLKEREAALRYQIRKKGMGLKDTPQLGGGGMTVGQVGQWAELFTAVAKVGTQAYTQQQQKSAATRARRRERQRQAMIAAQEAAALKAEQEAFALQVAMAAQKKKPFSLGKAAAIGGGALLGLTVLALALRKKR